MQVALLGDTHVPSRARRLPDAFRERIRSADHVVHTGDFDSESALADLRHLAPELTAVAGNTDPRLGLPAVATPSLGGVEFVVSHGTGPSRGYESRVAATAHEHAPTDDPVAVAGHTHEVVDTTRDGIRILNPGSATGARPADRTTMLTATASDGVLDVDVHEH